MLIAPFNGGVSSAFVRRRGTPSPVLIAPLNVVASLVPLCLYSRLLRTLPSKRGTLSPVYSVLFLPAGSKAAVFSSGPLWLMVVGLPFSDFLILRGIFDSRAINPSIGSHSVYFPFFFYSLSGSGLLF